MNFTAIRETTNCATDDPISLTSDNHTIADVDWDQVYEWSTFALWSIMIIWASHYYYKIKPHSIPSSFPGPKRHPFVGIMIYLLDKWDDWPNETVRMMNKYNGKTWGGPFLGIGGHPKAWFFTASPENLKYIIKDNFKNYEKGLLWANTFEELLGRGIFASDGKQWSIHRKVQAGMFSKNLLREYSKSFESVLDCVGTKFDSLIQMSGEQNMASIDIQDLFFRMTFDSISNVAFGFSYDSVQNEIQHPFALAFDEMQILTQQRIPDPFYRISRMFGLTKSERRIRQLTAVLNYHAYELINFKRRSAAEGSKLGPDVLSRFIDSAMRNNEPIDNTELRDIIMNILIAGRDTTACALSWTFYEITKRPDVMKRIIDEVNAGFCANGDCSYDSVNNLNYTHAVILEVLRLHPSVPLDSKVSINDSTLPDGTFIPAGSGVCYLILGMGKSEQIWGKDALQFKPERFLDQKEPSMYKYPAFNAGPRLCIGKPLAMITMKMALAYLLPRYEFIDTLQHPGETTWSLVLAMKGGYPLDFRKRKGTPTCNDNES